MPQNFFIRLYGLSPRLVATRSFQERSTIVIELKFDYQTLGSEMAMQAWPLLSPYEFVTRVRGYAFFARTLHHSPEILSF